MANRTRADIWLIRLLQLIGYVALLAFGAAIMPAQWIEELSEWLGFEPFPDSPLTFYLARNLSLLYGFVGATLLVIVHDYDRYSPAIRLVAIGTILFAVLQGIVNVQSRLPWWWIVNESLNTLIGGMLIYWFDVRARRARNEQQPVA